MDDLQVDMQPSTPRHRRRQVAGMCQVNLMHRHIFFWPVFIVIALSNQGSLLISKYEP
jgi:hypothetical protein